MLDMRDFPPAAIQRTLGGGCQPKSAPPVESRGGAALFSRAHTQ